MKKLLIALLCVGTLHVHAQDPEFPAKEFIMHLRIHNGMVTNFKASPDLFVGGLQLVPQYTLVKNKLRGGAIIGTFYTSNKLQATFGPTVSLKLASINLKSFGSGGNVHLALDHLWGTGKQRLAGGGVYADLLNFIVIGASLHRDYNLNNWWLQGSVALRISKVKKIPHP